MMINIESYYCALLIKELLVLHLASDLIYIMYESEFDYNILHI